MTNIQGSNLSLALPLRVLGGFSKNVAPIHKESEGVTIMLRSMGLPNALEMNLDQGIYYDPLEDRLASILLDRGD